MPIRFMVESISERRSWASSIGGDGEVAALDARAVADVADLELGVGVPGGVDAVDLEADTLFMVTAKRTSSKMKNSASGPK